MRNKSLALKQQTRQIVLAGAAMATLIMPAFAQADSTPEVSPAELIASMSKALKTLNYEGTFVHVHGSNLTTMRIMHANDTKGQFERLTALDGEEREVIRNNTLVTCIWPSSQAVIVSETKSRDLLPTVDATLIESEHYEFAYADLDRVAGRSTFVVNVIPRDDFRYGYRFWVDTDNSMLLRSMLLESNGMPVEQMMFTDIAFPESIEIALFDVLRLGERSSSFSWLESEEALAKATVAPRHSPLDAEAMQGVRPPPPKQFKDVKALSTGDDKVNFSGLPAGYNKVSETLSDMPAEHGPVRHIMLSDGMASVSVYVEFLYAPVPVDSEFTEGLSKMGAMNAFGLSVQNAFITAVGEVPEATVRAIASAVVLAE